MIGQSLALLGAALILFLGVFVAVATAVLAQLSGDEVSGWLPVWSNHLLESAVSLVPIEYQDRYREEWKAELASFRDRPLSGLRFAWRLRRRARCVSDVLADNETLGQMLEAAEPAPADGGPRPLEADAIAEIVRRVVERSRPRRQRKFAEILDEMREIIGEVRRDEVAGDLTAEYVDDISALRRQARMRPSLPAMSPRDPLPISISARARLAERAYLVEEWGSDYDADWEFLPDPAEREWVHYREEGASRGTRIGQVLRSWLRGEIRL
jgi:hypothetical protein